MPTGTASESLLELFETGLRRPNLQLPEGASAGPVWSVRIRQVAVLIAAVVADPGHREGQAILIAAFGNEIEVVVRVHDVLGSATLGGVGTGRYFHSHPCRRH